MAPFVVLGSGLRRNDEPLSSHLALFLCRGGVRSHGAFDCIFAVFRAITLSVNQPNRADHVLVIGDVEQPDPGAAASDHAQAFKRQADQLGLIGDQNQLVGPGRCKARHDRAIAADIVDIGDALTAAPGAPIFVSLTELAIAIGADGQDKLLALGQIAEPFLVRHFAFFFRLPSGIAQIFITLVLILHPNAVQD